MERINQSPNVIPVGPSDTTTYTPTLVAIRVTVAGDLVVSSGGSLVTIAAAANETIRMSVNKVMAATTATGLVGFQWPE